MGDVCSFSSGMFNLSIYNKYLVFRFTELYVNMLKLSGQSPYVPLQNLSPRQRPLYSYIKAWVLPSFLVWFEIYLNGKEKNLGYAASHFRA